MRNMFEYALKQIYYTSCTTHLILFIDYFGENFRYEDTPVEKLYCLYVSSIIFFIFCIFIPPSKLNLKMIICAIFVIFCIPLLQYDIYPSLTKYLFSRKNWPYFDDNKIYLDEYAITDIVSIIAFASTCIWRAKRTFGNSNTDSVTAA